MTDTDKMAIEEMARQNCHIEYHMKNYKTCKECYETNYCACRVYEVCRNLYNAGFRKQSEGEWISVEERLPETEGWYLVYTAPDKKHRSVNKAEFCKGFEWNNFEPYWRGAGGIWGNVTHWMPMPLPPHKSDPEQEELPL